MCVCGAERKVSLISHKVKRKVDTNVNNEILRVFEIR